jgi:thioredoxin-related protein
MKKSVFSLLTIVLIAYYAESSFSQQKQKDKDQGAGEKIKWYTFQEAYKLNKKKPKKVFVDVFTDWCGWCKKMDAETFANPVIAKYMSKEYYCVKLNAEMKDTIIIDGVTFTNPNPSSHRSTHQLANELLKGNMSYPSYVFLDGKNVVLNVVPGYQPSHEFEPIIHYFGENAYLKTPWEEFKTNFSGEIK